MANGLHGEIIDEATYTLERNDDSLQYDLF